MAGGLKDYVKQIHGIVASKALPEDDENRQHPHFVIPAHDEWMSRDEKDRQWSPAALEHARMVFAGEYKHPRTGRFSPSSIGDGCERLLLFGYAGAPQMPFPKANAEKMAAGEFHHLRWQMEGLSAGYMDLGEVWVHSEALRCGGSGDARLIDGSLFELKSTAEHLYKALKNGSGSAHAYVMGMHRKHKLQMETYWLVDQVGAAERGEDRLLNDWGSLVYQNAGNPGDIMEFRLRSSPSRRAEVHRILESLHTWVDLDQLPDMLDGCRKSLGEVYEDEQDATDKEVTVLMRCPYRTWCPTAESVSLPSER